MVLHFNAVHLGKWLVQASKQTTIHMHVCNAVTLVWGSLRLTPNNGKHYIKHSTEVFWLITCSRHMYILLNNCLVILFRSLKSANYAWKYVHKIVVFLQYIIELCKLQTTEHCIIGDNNKLVWNLVSEDVDASCWLSLSANFKKCILSLTSLWLLKLIINYVAVLNAILL